MTSRTQHIMPHAHDNGTCRVQFPCALQALRAPQLQRVCLESTGLARMRGKKGRPMPVNAGNLAWLLHHPRLETVSISASEVSCSSPVPHASCILHASDMVQLRIATADVSHACQLMGACLVLSLFLPTIDSSHYRSGS